MSNNTTTRPKKQLIIGIDPDTKASGWACIDLSDRTVHLETLPFMDILAILTEWRREEDDHYLDEAYSYRFVVEDIWRVAHNWHVSPRDNRLTISKKGYHIGRCSMVGQLIYEAIGAHFFPRIAQYGVGRTGRFPTLSFSSCAKSTTSISLPPSRRQPTKKSVTPFCLPFTT